MSRTCARDGCDQPLSSGRKYCSQGCYRRAARGELAEVTSDLVAGLDLERVTELARNGCSLETIAEECGVTRPTFLKLRQEHPALEAAFLKGRAGLEDELVGLLLKKARQGQSVPILFALKSMFGYREGEPRRGEGGVHATVQIINLPAPMTPEQYRAQRDAVLVEAVEVSDDGS